jgi:hypothetical protein
MFVSLLPVAHSHLLQLPVINDVSVMRRVSTSAATSLQSCWCVYLQLSITSSSQPLPARLLLLTLVLHRFINVVVFLVIITLPTAAQLFSGIWRVCERAFASGNAC